MGLAIYHWQKYSELVPKDPDAKQHIDDIRKPLLTKKQVEQLAMEKKMKQTKAETAALSAFSQWITVK